MRSRVLHDVVDRLLRDPVERVFGRQRQAGQVGADVESDHQAGSTLDRAEVLSKGGHEAILGETARPELEDQAAHLAEGLARERAQLVELGLDAGLVPFEEHPGRPGGDVHAEQRLGHRVMELLGEVRSLATGGQLGGLLPDLPLQPQSLAHLPDGAGPAAIPTIDRRADVVHLDRDRVAVLVTQVDPIGLVAVGVRDLPSIALLEGLADDSCITISELRPMSSSGR